MDAADRATLDLRPERPERGCELDERRREQQQAALRGKLEHGLRLGSRQGDRLLADHVLAVLEGEPRQLGVTLRRSQDDDDVHVRGQHFLHGEHGPCARTAANRSGQASRRRAQIGPSTARPRGIMRSRSCRYAPEDAAGADEPDGDRPR